MGPIKRPKTPQKAGDNPSVQVGPNPFKKLETLGELQSSEPSLLTAQGINHPKTSASHEQNRLKCCAVCWIYTKKPLNESLKTEIQRLFEIVIDYSDYSKLDPNFEQIIDDFKNTLVVLREVHDISITPKFHMICIEIKRICQITGHSLKFNEQSLESSHKKFKTIVLRFAGVDADTDNPLWPLNILRALEVFNSNATFRDSR